MSTLSLPLLAKKLKNEMSKSGYFSLEMSLVIECCMRIGKNRIVVGFRKNTIQAFSLCLLGGTENLASLVAAEAQCQEMEL